MPSIKQSNEIVANSISGLDTLVRRADSRTGKVAAGQRPIWIDLENSPHVPFFRPIIRELEARGFSVLVTARDCFQVCGLAKQLHVECKAIGRHYGKHRLMKFLGLGIRTLQLLPSLFRSRPALAVSHGSRSQLVAAKLLGIPTLQIVDYEFAKIWAVVQPSWVLTPTMISDSSIHLSRERVLKYPGIKEDVYVPSFVPQDGIRRELGISENEILVTLRPPASEAHYHNPDSDKLFKATISHLEQISNVRMVVLPRTPRQGEDISEMWPELCAQGKLLIPKQVLDGLNLIWHSDLVISGGGTMNREAAALGVPVYSIFRGIIGAVDHFLSGEGRLVLLESPADLATKLKVQRRDRTLLHTASKDQTLQAVTHEIVRLAQQGSNRKAA